MSDNQSITPSEELLRITESAKRLGVELDEEEALQWLTAIAASQTGEDLVVDTDSGVFGHKVVMLDFSTEELARFREIGEIVGFKDRPGVVETALALSGSSAQSKVQTYPGDCDYFERVNIIAPTREEVCQILADVMREKILSSAKGPNYQISYIQFGSYPYDVTKDGKRKKAGWNISWTLEEVRAGQLEALRPDGTPTVILWQDAALNSGWCKLDWIVADPIRGQLANASNILDVTWEAPDGTITPLDGYLDGYFQEVYLEAESVPLFSKLSRNMAGNALDDYVERLEGEIRNYLNKHLNYGKVAKRMYNIFRLTGRYQEAAFVRELFDEPATMLYQVWSLIDTLDHAVQPGLTIPKESLLAQADQLIMTVVKTLEGDQETEIVRLLLRLRDCISSDEREDNWYAAVQAAKAEVINVVNNFFYERLTALPEVKTYMEQFQTQTIK